MTSLSKKKEKQKDQSPFLVIFFYGKQKLFREKEKKEFLEEMIPPALYSMFVTPKDVDETMKRLSYTISEGLNRVFC